MQARRVLALALLLAALCCVADAERVRRRHKRLRTTTLPPPAGAQADAGVEAAAGAGAEAAAREDSEAEQIELAMAERRDEQRFLENERARANDALSQGGPDALGDDPCGAVHCSAGRVCEIDEHGEAACNCIRECPHETEDRRKVCTNHNETWPSDCEVYRARCLCLEGGLCRGARDHHVQIEYYGACRAQPACAPHEMADFPRRMRDWLFNVMRDLAERRELSPHYLRMEREAEAELARRWTNAAVWKWCDLDAHDKNRFVSRHELFPIRAPLMSLEHCIAPFLDSCDADDDHRITLAEWGACLQLDAGELEDRCDEFTDDAAAAPADVA